MTKPQVLTRHKIVDSPYWGKADVFVLDAFYVCDGFDVVMWRLSSLQGELGSGLHGAHRGARTSPNSQLPSEGHP